jgi:hypothetical protein
MKNATSSMEVRFNEVSGQRHLHATKLYHAGEVITAFGALNTLPIPTYLTLQVGTDKHIILTPEILQYCNHSCDPNVFFDTARMEFQALKEIGPGDELTFFYPSTEWEMAQPFQCFCGTTNCLGMIQGASLMPEQILAGYVLTNFIHRQLEQRMTEAAIAETVS